MAMYLLYISQQCVVDQGDDDNQFIQARIIKWVILGLFECAIYLVLGLYVVEKKLQPFSDGISSFFNFFYNDLIYQHDLLIA